MSFSVTERHISSRIRKITTSLLFSDFLWQCLLVEGLREASDIQLDNFSVSLLLIISKRKGSLAFLLSHLRKNLGWSFCWRWQWKSRYNNLNTIRHEKNNFDLALFASFSSTNCFNTAIFNPRINSVVLLLQLRNLQFFLGHW